MEESEGKDKNFCQCGCGMEISLTSKHRGEKQRFKQGHWGKSHHWQKSGPEHGAWKGGRFIDYDGYIVVRNDKPHPRGKGPNKLYVREHILIMEKHLGRPITVKEAVHHKDGNRQNNSISNLHVMIKRYHTSHHVRKDMSDRFCSLCSSKITTSRIVDRIDGPIRRPHWYRHPNTKDWICTNCYQRLRYSKK